MTTFPSLYEINTRVLLREWSDAAGRRLTLDDVPDPFLDAVSGAGFNWVWFLGVWQTGEAARKVSLARPEWRMGYQQTLADFRDEDVSGSPFAVAAYELNRDFGDAETLPRLRERLRTRGIRLMLDFVPNHGAPDHPWVRSHPEFFVRGNEDDMTREPQNYARTPAGILAYGRDPYFDGWPDTLQFNYRHRGLREERIRELLRIAQVCDGVRCDMAMLVLPDVFFRTWGRRSHPSDGSVPADDPFWVEAIRRVKERHPDFVFMGEAYWDLEWTLHQQGFDYTYDKRLYDRLRHRDAALVRGHLQASPEYQRQSVHFLENHDEPRAAAAFPGDIHPAAAILTYLTPGLRFFHEGQFEGRRVHVSMHLGRRPKEPVDEKIREFYERLLRVLRRPEVREGDWRLLDVRPAWEGNRTFTNIMAFSIEQSDGRKILIDVNYGPAQGQGYVAVPWDDLRGRRCILRDLMGSEEYERDGSTLAGQGLYLDLRPWGYNVFEIGRAE